MKADEDREHRWPRAQGVGRDEGLLTGPTRPPAHAGGPRFRLRASVDAIRAPDGDLFFTRAGEGDLVVRQPDELDVALVGALGAAERTVSELASSTGAAPAVLEDKLASLLDAGVVLSFEGPAPVLSGADGERFSRQLPFLAEFGEPAAMQRALRATHVLVIGTGGLGAWTVASLCASGIGSFTLVDPDLVELSNLNRQILFGSRSIGRAKVDETARWIRSFDERVTVTCLRSAIAGAAQVASQLAGVDLVVLAADHPPHDLACWVNEACMAHGVPFVAAGQHLPIVKVGPTYVPGRTACFACHAAQLRRESPLYDEYVAHVRDAERPDATLGSTSGIVGSMVAIDILHLLLTGTCATAGSATILDVTTFDTRSETVVRNPACDVCQHLDAWQPMVMRSG